MFLNYLHCWSNIAYRNSQLSSLDHYAIRPVRVLFQMTNTRNTALENIRCDGNEYIYRTRQTVRMRCEITRKSGVNLRIFKYGSLVIANECRSAALQRFHQLSSEWLAKHVLHHALESIRPKDSPKKPTCPSCSLTLYPNSLLGLPEKKSQQPRVKSEQFFTCSTSNSAPF